MKTLAILLLTAPLLAGPAFAAKKQPHVANCVDYMQVTMDARRAMYDAARNQSSSTDLDGLLFLYERAHERENQHCPVTGDDAFNDSLDLQHKQIREQIIGIIVDRQLEGR